MAERRLSGWTIAFRVFAVLFAVGFTGAIVAGIAGAIYVARLADDLPDYAQLREYEPKVMTRIHAGDGTLLAEYATERRIFVPIEAIPPHVVNAFISAEDRTFYEHHGLDYRGIARAALANVSNYLNNRRLEGAATITQQVAKNFLLSGEVRLERKIREALLALRMEEAFTKEHILELYLNEIYLGWRSYGVAAASLNYFDKSLQDLTVAEAAYLAAMPKGPNNYRPDRHGARERGIARRNWVIGRMAANGYITPAEAEVAQAEELLVYERVFGTRTVEGEYFAEEVRRRVAGLYGEESLYDGGLSVRTTIEPELQRHAMTALRGGLVAYDQRHGWRGAVGQLGDLANWAEAIRRADFATDLAPWSGAVVLGIDDTAGTVSVGLQDGQTTGTIALDQLTWARQSLPDRTLGAEIERPSQVLSVGDLIYVEPVDGDAAGQFALRQVPDVNGGLVALDPHTGRVLAMMGGFSFEESQFNRAVQARRQPGSSFKPFVYAAAFDNGYTPSSVVLDAPFTLDQGEDMPLWKPNNYSNRFYGPSTLRRGMERSLNVLTVRLALDVGIEDVVAYGERMGVYERPRPLLSMAVGSGETTLLRMTTAYGMFVNGGHEIAPVFIDRIQDRLGRTVYRHDQRDCLGCAPDAWAAAPMPQLPDARARVLDSHTAYQVVSLLQGVVDRGTATTVRTVGKPLAGKTGTTDDEKDAWFVGFSPDLAVGVYVGFDIPTSMGHSETGGSVAAPIFRDFMALAVGDKPAVPFRVPSGITLMRVNSETGQRARPGDGRVIEEAFKPGTGPDPEAFRNVLGAGASTDPDAPVSGSTRVNRGTGGLY